MLSFWAKKTFSAHGVQTRFTPVPKLVLTGPYAFTRNPLYVSLILVYAGISLLANSVWPLVLMPLPVVYLYYNVVLLEEAYLESEFGGEYLEYKGKVRRWL
ncbi:MAG: isoprenylcysteine carboxylmethyltransferase family protein [Candidatus Diapherotrites archaeon]|nr:isoprenylcysteine carboxylmethyltransferase family protein [Candidatus Diapherotrites archaeon]